MQQSHHQGIFPDSTRFTAVQSLLVRPGIVPGSPKYICSIIITVHYGLPRSTHVNTRSNKSGSSRWTPVSSRWTPGSSRSTYGGHPVHPGQQTVHPSQHMVHYGSLQFIPVNTRFITVHYGALRFTTVHPGQHPVLPGQHQVWIFSPVWCRFDRIIKHVSSFKICSRSTQGYSRFVPVGHGSSRSTPGSSRLVNQEEPWWWDCSIKLHISVERHRVMSWHLQQWF